MVTCPRSPHYVIVGPPMVGGNLWEPMGNHRLPPTSYIAVVFSLQHLVLLFKMVWLLLKCFPNCLPRTNDDPFMKIILQKLPRLPSFRRVLYNHFRL